MSAPRDELAERRARRRALSAAPLTVEDLAAKVAESRQRVEAEERAQTERAERARAEAARAALERLDAVVERARAQAETRMEELRRLHRAGRRSARAFVAAALLLLGAALASIALVLHESRTELAATRAALDRSARAHGRALEAGWARDRQALSDLLDRRVQESDRVRARE